MPKITLNEFVENVDECYDHMEEGEYFIVELIDGREVVLVARQTFEDISEKSWMYEELED